MSRRALAPANVTVYVWYAASPTIAKCIWSMAIAQHHFFIERSNKKVSTVRLFEGFKFVSFNEINSLSES